MERKIIHIDMDAFFASVEQRDNPELRGKPIAVGEDSRRSVVSTASYEARPYGVHSALSMELAKRLCPSLIIVPHHFDRYKEVSAQMHAIFHDYTDMVEPISLDEAFLDVTNNKKGVALAVDIAREIKARIREELQLTASAGVSYNKFLAKIASDYRKPDGLCTIHPDRALDFIADLPIEKFWAVGPKTAAKFHRMGIFEGRQLRKCSRGHLVEEFGKMGNVFYDFARGIDNRPVVSEWIRKSVGCESTYEQDLSSETAMIIEIYHLVIELLRRIAKNEFRGRTLTLKVKYAGFRQITRSVTRVQPFLEKKEILEAAKRLLKEVDKSEGIRLLGLAVSNSVDEQMTGRGQWIEGELDFKE